MLYFNKTYSGALVVGKVCWMELWCSTLAWSIQPLIRFLVAPMLPCGGLWLGHMAPCGWPPTHQWKSPKSAPMKFRQVARHDWLNGTYSTMPSQQAQSSYHISSIDYWLGCQKNFQIRLFWKMNKTCFWEHTESISRETSCVEFKVTRTMFSFKFHTNLTNLNFEQIFEHLIIPPH